MANSSHGSFLEELERDVLASFLWVNRMWAIISARYTEQTKAEWPKHAQPPPPRPTQCRVHVRPHIAMTLLLLHINHIWQYNVHCATCGCPTANDPSPTMLFIIRSRFYFEVNLLHIGAHLRVHFCMLTRLKAIPLLKNLCNLQLIL